MDFALAVYERRSALGLSSAELAERAGLTIDEIEHIEESGVDPTLELIESLAEALHSGALIDPRATPEFRFESRAAQPHVVMAHAAPQKWARHHNPPTLNEYAACPDRQRR